MKITFFLFLSIAIVQLHGMEQPPAGHIIQKIKEPRPLNDTIILAIKRDDLDAVNNFIASKINLNEKHDEPFQIECRQGNYSVPRTIYKRDKSAMTALMYAAEHGRLAIVKSLLTAGANPNLQNHQHHTALTLCNKHTDVAQALLEGGANPNIKTFLGFTALMYSLMCRDRTRVKLLMDHKADPTIANDLGCTGESYAIEAGPEFVALLAQYRQPQTIVENSGTPMDEQSKTVTP